MAKSQIFQSAFIATFAFSIVSAFAEGNSHDQIHKLEHIFEHANIVDGPTIVDCKLSNKSETKCFSITVKAEPKSYTPGPWCPTNVADGPEKSGIWLHEGEALDADGKFMSNLATLFDDEKWNMVNKSNGEIKITSTREQCAAAARPDVGVEYENFCVECRLEYMEEGTTITYTIPLVPEDNPVANSTRRAGSGIAINGIRLDGPAPVDAILGAYTIAPFDDCGGHVNLNVGYHYHSATNCLDDLVESSEDHGTVIGIAMDGYEIMSHSQTDGTTPKDLDSCNGHKSDDGSYHYHAGTKGSNAILGCLTGAYGCVSSNPNAKCDASARRRRPK